MNYSKSRSVLQAIKKADKILINCHKNVDPDSLSSALTLKLVLEKMGKKVTVISPQEIPNAYDFFKEIKEIRVSDLNKFPFEKYDLLLMVDTAGLEHAGIKNPDVIKIPIIVIDHHITNGIPAEISLKDTEMSSVAEMVYLLLNDWRVKITPQMAGYLLAGICTDTGFYQFTNSSPSTLRNSADLVDLGANMNEIVYHFSRKYAKDFIKLLGEILLNLQTDTKHKFSWSTISYKEYRKYKFSLSVSSYASNILRTIRDTNFCAVMIEYEPKHINISFRARVSGFDVSRVADELGGGGHIDASGASVDGLEFKAAVDKVLRVMRKYSHQPVNQEIFNEKKSGSK